MGRLRKKKTGVQLQKKKEKEKGSQDTKNPAVPAVDVRSGDKGSLVRTGKTPKKTSKSASSSRSAAKPDKKMALAKGLKFFREARAELLKVVWPSRAQAMASTLVVIVLVLIVSFFLGIADAVLGKLVGLILS